MEYTILGNQRSLKRELKAMKFVPKQAVRLWVLWREISFFTFSSSKTFNLYAMFYISLSGPFLRLYKLLQPIPPYWNCLRPWFSVLAAHWNRLGTFRNYWCQSPTCRDWDFTLVGQAKVLGAFKFPRGFSHAASVGPLTGPGGLRFLVA